MHHSHQFEGPFRPRELAALATNLRVETARELLSGSMPYYDKPPHLQKLGSEVIAESIARDGQVVPDTSYSVQWGDACDLIHLPVAKFHRDHNDGIPDVLLKQLEGRVLEPHLNVQWEGNSYLVVDIQHADGPVLTEKPIDATLIAALSLLPMKCLDLSTSDTRSASLLDVSGRTKVSVLILLAVSVAAAMFAKRCSEDPDARLPPVPAGDRAVR